MSGENVPQIAPADLKQGRGGCEFVTPRMLRCGERLDPACPFLARDLDHTVLVIGCAEHAKPWLKRRQDAEDQAAA